MKLNKQNWRAENKNKKLLYSVDNKVFPRLIQPEPN